MIPLLIGGLLPALFIGIALTFLKVSSLQGISAGTGMIFTGIGVTLAGVVAHLLGLSGGASGKSIPLSLLVGIFWGTGTLLMSYAVSRLNLSITISASLAAANVIVVSLLGVFFLGEGDGVSLLKLSIGITAIVAGSILVTTA
jgi:hypothetical protein